MTDGLSRAIAILELLLLFPVPVVDEGRGRQLLRGQLLPEWRMGQRGRRIVGADGKSSTGSPITTQTADDSQLLQL